MIEAKHEIPLTTAITKCAPGRGAIVQALYRECLSLFNNVPTKTAGVTKQRSVVDRPPAQLVTATVTDDEGGLFVQLTGVLNAEKKVQEGPFLTFGKKYLEESKNPQLSNTAVRLWH